MGFSIDIDIGGTFTDLFVAKESEGFQIGKTPTTHYDLSVGFMKGIKEMDRLPDAVFIIDTKRERIAVNEANKLEIPVIAIVDTNTDPDGIDYPIPGNDDAIRSLKLITSHIAEAILEGHDEWLTKLAEVEEEQKEEREKEEKASQTKPKPRRRTKQKSPSQSENKAEAKDESKESTDQ